MSGLIKQHVRKLLTAVFTENNVVRIDNGAGLVRAVNVSDAVNKAFAADDASILVVNDKGETVSWLFLETYGSQYLADVVLDHSDDDYTKSLVVKYFGEASLKTT